MKYTKPDGTTIEGTSEEIREFLNDRTTAQHTNKVDAPIRIKPFVNRTFTLGRRLWSKEDHETLRQAVANHEKIYIIAKNLNRTEKAIYDRAHLHGFDILYDRVDRHKKSVKNRGNSWSKEEDAELKALYPYHQEKQVADKYGRTISACLNRAGKIHLTRIIRAPYNKSHVVKVLEKAAEQDGSFPEFDSVQDGFGSILRDMVSNVIKSKGKMTFGMDGIALGMTNVRDWKAFCEEFIMKASQIAAHFSVRNQFVYDGYWIKYVG